jgi:hypothetical protein
MKLSTIEIDQNFNYEIIVLFKIGGEHEVGNKKFPLEVILNKGYMLY